MISRTRSDVPLTVPWEERKGPGNEAKGVHGAVEGMERTWEQV